MTHGRWVVMASWPYVSGLMMLSNGSHLDESIVEPVKEGRVRWVARPGSKMLGRCVRAWRFEQGRACFHCTL